MLRIDKFYMLGWNYRTLCSEDPLWKAMIIGHPEAGYRLITYPENFTWKFLDAWAEGWEARAEFEKAGRSQRGYRN